MIYHLFEFLRGRFSFPGINLMSYISFRAGISLIFSLWISLIYGKKIILWIRKKQIGETIRDLNLQGQLEKKGTPTMGGIIIILATIVPCLLFMNLSNLYVWLLMLTLVWMGFVGFIDDYIKVFKKNKIGLSGKLKLISQIVLGIFVGCTIYFNKDISVKEKTKYSKTFSIEERNTTKTTLPFVKNNEFDYADILSIFNKEWEIYAWIIFIPIVIFIICAVSNGCNLSDGIDGLAAGSSAIVISVLALFGWVSGNTIMANYLNIMHIPNVGEVVVFSAAFIGAIIGFLWYNTYPAQVFMGDTGSLSIGGVIAVLAILTRKELILPLLCGVFFIETLSVILQVLYFKYTKKRCGTGRRIFLMAPLHHHFQLKGYHESKIVFRFLIIQFMLGVMSIISLKIR